MTWSESSPPPPSSSPPPTADASTPGPRLGPGPARWSGREWLRYVGWLALFLLVGPFVPAIVVGFVPEPELQLLAWYLVVGVPGGALIFAMSLVAPVALGSAGVLSRFPPRRLALLLGGVPFALYALLWVVGVVGFFVDAG